MPQFSDQIQQRDVSFSPRAPVVDRSAEQAITAIGSTVLAAREGKEQARLEGAIQQDVNAFLGAQQIPTLEQQAAEQERAITQIDEEAGGVFADDPGRIAAVGEFEGTMRKLQVAKESGIMSASALRNRVQAELRKSINTMPGRADVLRRLAANTIGDFSEVISSVEQQQRDAVAQQAASEKELKKYVGTTLGMGLFAANRLNEPAIAEEAARRDQLFRQGTQAELSKNLYENTAAANEITMTQQLHKAGPQFVAGSTAAWLNFLNTNSQGQALIQQLGRPVDSIADLQEIPVNLRPLATTLLEQFATNRRQQFTSAWAGAQAKLSDIKLYTDMEDNFRSKIADLMSGKQAADTFTNAETTMTKGLVLGLNNTPQGRAILNYGTIAKYSGGLPQQISTKIGNLAVEHVMSVGEAMKGINPSSTNAPNGGGVAGFAAPLVGGYMSDDAAGNIPSEQKQTLADPLINMLINVGGNPQRVSIKDHTELLNIYSDPDIMKFGKQGGPLEPLMNESVRKTSFNYIERAVNDLRNQIENEFQGTSAGRLDLSIDPTTGRMEFTPNPSTTGASRSSLEATAARWNRTYSDPMNKAVMALAHAGGNKRGTKFRASVGSLQEERRSVLDLSPEEAGSLFSNQGLSSEELEVEAPTQAQADTVVNLASEVRAATTPAAKLKVLTDAGLGEDDIRGLMESVGLNPSTSLTRGGF